MNLVTQCAIIAIGIVAQIFTTLLVVFAAAILDVLGLFFFMKVLFMLVLAFVWYFESHDRFLLSYGSCWNGCRRSCNTYLA